MSKKSRRRNKKILGALGALGLGLALANRGKGTEMSNISVDSGRGGDSASAKARADANKIAAEVPKKVYEDAIMRGGRGVKQGFKTTSANVQKGNIEPPGLFSQGKVKFKEPVITLPEPKYEGSAEFQRKVLRAKKDAKRNDMLRAIRSGAPVQAADPIMEFDQSQGFGFGVMAKKGGRIVKGKKTAVRKVGIAKRGFGRAMKRSK
jgi:hypothetical protein